MQGYFKKRKRAQGPNKNEQKVQRAREAENQGVLGARFPLVKTLRVRLTFLDAGQRVLNEQTMVLVATDAADFSLPCPGRCGRGSFNLEPKIAATIDAKLPVAEAGAKCPEPIFAGSAETCGCEVKCRLEIDYRS